MGLAHVVAAWIFLLCLVRFSKQQHVKRDCEVWCTTSENKKCSGSEVQPCEVRFDADPFPEPRMEQTAEVLDFQTGITCENNTTIAFEISWIIEGEDIRRNRVKKFYIEVSHAVGLSREEQLPGGVLDQELAIEIPTGLCLDHNVAFRYFFHGSEDFIIKRDLATVMKLRLEPGYKEETNYTGVKRIPVDLVGVDGCQSDQTETTTSPPKDPSLITWLIASAIGLLIMLIALAIVVCSILKKQRVERDSKSQERKNLLILLNPGILDNDAKEHVTEIAIRLSIRAKEHIANVYSNIAQTVGISTDDLQQWLTTCATSSDFVILFSVPDVTEKTMDFERYNNAFDRILKRLVEEQSWQEKIFIVRTKSKDEYSSCRFVNSGFYKDIQVTGGDEDWKEILDHIIMIKSEDTDSDTSLLSPYRGSHLTEYV